MKLLNKAMSSDFIIFQNADKTMLGNHPDLMSYCVPFERTSFSLNVSDRISFSRSET
jgi:hypothetical protein